MKILRQWFSAWLATLDMVEIQLDGRPYLTRYFVFGEPKKGRWALMLHHMHRPDMDRCHHDHPWPFTTLVLRGGYTESISMLDAEGVPYRSFLRWNPPGTIRRNAATHTHRVATLPNGDCWTLVLRGRKVRSWGFWSGLGEWVGWKVFEEWDWGKRVAWCEEGYDAQQRGSNDG